MRIGIIGGAGPMAGVLLAKKVFSTFQERYGARDDADFPELILYSVPFAQMLQAGSANQEDERVAVQLRDAMDLLLGSGATAMVIACNTLHSYLDERGRPPELIDLVRETESAIARAGSENCLLLCTGTSVKRGTYALPGSCTLLPTEQGALDALIDRVLAGDESSERQRELELLIRQVRRRAPKIDSVVLACTELSLLMDKYSWELPGIRIFDPLDCVCTLLCSTQKNN